MHELLTQRQDTIETYTSRADYEPGCFFFREENPRVVDVILSRCEDFRVFDTYISEYDRSMFLLEESRRNSPAFASIAKKFEVNHVTWTEGCWGALLQTKIERNGSLVLFVLLQYFQSGAWRSTVFWQWHIHRWGSVFMSSLFVSRDQTCLLLWLWRKQLSIRILSPSFHGR